jgi:endonuclease/exonuclease/phosphatase (EEP) superfamily protein YafD
VLWRSGGFTTGPRGIRQTSVVEDQKVRYRWVTVVLVVAAIPFAVLAALRFFGIDGERHTVAALALTPYAAVCGLVLAALTLALRRWWTGGVVLVLAVALTALVLPRLFASDQPEVTGPRLRVMSSNLLAGQADAQQLVNLVRENEVDVLSLLELTQSGMDRLTRAGLFSLLPNTILHPSRTGAAGSGLASRYPLTKLGLSGPSSGKQPSARLTLAGGVPVDVVAAHPAAPIWNASVWRTEFGNLPSPDFAGPPRILAGDFNATLDHAILRDLLDSGYADAAERLGEGLSTTWPSSGLIPPVVIDHVLVDRRVAVKAYRVFDVPGSDHRAVYAELILPS